MTPPTNDRCAASCALGAVSVEADDVVSDFDCTQGQRQAHVALSDDNDFATRVHRRSVAHDGSRASDRMPTSVPGPAAGPPDPERLFHSATRSVRTSGCPGRTSRQPVFLDGHPQRLVEVATSDVITARSRRSDSMAHPTRAPAAARNAPSTCGAECGTPRRGRQGSDDGTDGGQTPSSSTDRLRARRRTVAPLPDSSGPPRTKTRRGPGYPADGMTASVCVDFSDFWPGFDKHDNWFVDLLSRRYDLQIRPSPNF